MISDHTRYSCIIYIYIYIYIYMVICIAPYSSLDALYGGLKVCGLRFASNIWMMFEFTNKAVRIYFEQVLNAIQAAPHACSWSGYCYIAEIPRLWIWTLHLLVVGLPHYRCAIMAPWPLTPHFNQRSSGNRNPIRNMMMIIIIIIMVIIITNNTISCHFFPFFFLVFLFYRQFPDKLAYRWGQNVRQAVSYLSLTRDDWWPANRRPSLACCLH